MEKRMEALEMLSMEQENTIETLNREVHRQQLSLRSLTLQIEHLKTQLESINKEEPLSPEAEEEAPPPHY